MFNEFKNKYLGKKVDIDGKYGGQCVDLFNAWNEDYNGCRLNCMPSGYAKSLAENKENNGILNYFVETEIDNMIEGTVVIYGDCKFAPKSHVCFFIKDNGDGTYQALQQNYNNNQFVTINNNPYNGIIGAFIPIQLLNKEITLKNDDEIINEILDGIWDNGEDRKNNLKNQGYDYERIQNKINELYVVAQNVIRGNYGNGEERKEKLKNQGYNYELVQKIVNMLS